MQEHMLSVRAVANMLGVSECTVYRLKDKPDGLRAYKVGRCLRFKREDVDAYLYRQAVVPAAHHKKGPCEVRFKYIPGMKVV